MEHAQSHQQHPIGLYLKVWTALFVLSFFSYMVDYHDVQGFWRWFLVLTFMVLKAGAIMAVFMHMVWERLSLILTVLLPPLCLLVLVFFLAFEGIYITALRNLYFVFGG